MSWLGQPPGWLYHEHCILDDNFLRLIDGDFMQMIAETLSRRPSVIVLIGPPASGKSQWRAAFQEQRAAAGLKPAVILSSDDKVEAMARAAGKRYSEIFPSIDMPAINQQLDEERKAALRQRQTIVVDRTNLSVDFRGYSLRNLPRDYRRIGLVFTADMPVLEQRLATRAEREGKVITMDVVADMMTTYEPPTPQEFDVIRYLRPELTPVAAPATMGGAASGAKSRTPDAARDACQCATHDTAGLCHPQSVRRQPKP
ncbi:MAG: ATP-binding protein [Pseudomonadota bacterium]